MDETIAPDVAPLADEPLDPGTAVHDEESRYGENSTNPNRDDQYDEHHGKPDDIV